MIRNYTARKNFTADLQSLKQYNYDFGSNGAHKQLSKIIGDHDVAFSVLSSIRVMFLNDIIIIFQQTTEKDCLNNIFRKMDALKKSLKNPTDLVSVTCTGDLRKWKNCYKHLRDAIKLFKRYKKEFIDILQVSSPLINGGSCTTMPQYIIVNNYGYSICGTTTHRYSLSHYNNN